MGTKKFGIVIWENKIAKKSALYLYNFTDGVFERQVIEDGNVRGNYYFLTEKPERHYWGSIIEMNARKGYGNNKLTILSSWEE